MLNQEIIKQLAEGNENAIAEVQKLPATLKMSYGIAANEYARNNDIVKTEVFSLYGQKKQASVDNEGIANSLSKFLEERRIKEELIEKQRQEYADKKAKQLAERARALGSYQ